MLPKDTPEPFDASELFDRPAARDEPPVRQIGIVTRYVHNAIHEALLEHIMRHHSAVPLATIEDLRAQLEADS